MVNMNLAIVIFLFIIVLILLYYNWRITCSVYDLEDELDTVYARLEDHDGCLKEIALACDNNTEFIESLCDEIINQEENISEQS